MKRTIFTIITAGCLALTAMAQNDPVAAIPGKLDVTSLGAATYHIPITVPSGVNGLQPNISLNYNSNAENGLAGWGFGLNAYSMISRTGRDIVHDGTSKPITWDGNDNFVLDGQRLIMVKQAGTYLTPGTEYRTEIESYRKISMIAANGTTGFQVQAKDGTIYEYGTTDDSQFYLADHSIPITMGIMHWLLHKVTDSNGNYMTYYYGNNSTNNEYWIDRIEYGGNTNTGTTAMNKIQFTYHSTIVGIESASNGTSGPIKTKYIYDYNRPDCSAREMGGCIAKQTRLLTSIKTYTNSYIQNQYILNYETFDGKVSKLQSIEVKNSQGESLKPTSINWGTVSNMNLQETGIYTGDIIKGSKYSRLFLDFDNDGIDDEFLYLKSGTPTKSSVLGWIQLTSKNDQNYNFKTSESVFQFFNLYNNIGYKNYQYNKLIDTKYIPVDVNKDNKIDLIEIRYFGLSRPNNSKDFPDLTHYENLDLDYSHPQIDILINNNGTLMRLNLGWQTEFEKEYDQLGGYIDIGVLNGYSNLQPLDRYTIQRQYYSTFTVEQNQMGEFELVESIHNFHAEHISNMKNENLYEKLFNNKWEQYVTKSVIDKVKYYDIDLSRKNCTLIEKNQVSIRNEVKSTIPSYIYASEINSAFITLSPPIDSKGDEIMQNCRFFTFQSSLNRKNGFLSFSGDEATINNQEINFLDKSRNKISFTNFNIVTFSDFNGDGKTDILAIDKQFNYTIFECQNSDFVEITKYDPSQLYQSHNNLKDEFSKFAKSYLELNIPYGLFGYQFGIVYKSVISSIFDWTSKYLSTLPFTIEEVNPTIGDFNGDGKADIIFSSFKMDYGQLKNIDTNERSYKLTPLKSVLVTTEMNSDGSRNTKVQSFLLSDSIVYVRRSPYSHTDNILLSNKSIMKFNCENNLNISSIQDGLGNTQAINYSTLSNSLYSIGNSSSNNSNVKTVTYPEYKVVASTSLSNGNTAISSNFYNYQGLKTNTSGYGLIGFDNITRRDILGPMLTKTYQTDTPDVFKNLKELLQMQLDIQTAIDTAIVTSTTYGYNPSYYIPYMTAQTVTKKATLISSVTITNQVRTSNVGGFTLNANKILQPYVSVQTATDHLSGISTTTEYLGVDDQNNPSKIKTTKGGMVKIDSMTYICKGSWCKNKLSDMTSTVTYSTNAPYIRTSNYTYDATNGNLLTTVTDPTDADLKVTNTYTYDKFGNQLTVKSSTKGGYRESSNTYYPSGRFIQTKKDIVGNTTTYVWDETKGTLTSQTDHTGTTSYIYDNWKTLTSTTLPTGITQSALTSWANDVAGALYKTETSVSKGAPPVTQWYDARGNVIQTKTYYLKSGSPVYQFTEYNKNGSVQRTSSPTYILNTKTWDKTYGYDSNGRVIAVNSSEGIDSISYTTNSTTYTKSSGQRKTVNTNTAGWTSSVVDNGKTITYDYYSSGLVKSIYTDASTHYDMEYNLHGNRTKITDPDAGVITSQYNGFGDLTQQINNQSVTTKYFYGGPGGALSLRDRNGEETKYRYDNFGRLIEKVICAYDRKTYTYDTFDRVTKLVEVIGVKPYTTQYRYDAAGNETIHTYHSGYKTTNTYDDYGQLIDVTDSYQKSIWTSPEYDAKGRLTSVVRGGVTSTSTFDDLGRLTSSLAAKGTNAPIINMEYTYSDGNLSSRTDHLNSLYERFQYDQLDRLKTWGIYNYIPQTGNGPQPPSKGVNITYDDEIATPKGNIIKKSDIGNYEMKYNATRIHALDSIIGKPDSIVSSNWDVKYNTFNKPTKITQAEIRDAQLKILSPTKTYNITYGADDQRIQTQSCITYAPQQTTTYTDDYEEVFNNITGGYQLIHYLRGAIFTQRYDKSGTKVGTDSLMYTYHDHQGSLIALVTDSPSGDGGIERYAYDPWGRRRNPADWTEYDKRTKWITHRGYTGHEHIDFMSGLINMNGRVYDPITAQFLSVDNIIQAPDSWVNYNRYAYCMNNPLNYTDPSGWDYTKNGQTVYEVDPGLEGKNGQGYYDTGQGPQLWGSTVTVTPSSYNPTNFGNGQSSGLYGAYSQSSTYGNSGISNSYVNQLMSSNNSTVKVQQNGSQGNVGTPWMNTALDEYKSGVKEVPRGSNSGPRVNVYLKYAGASSPNAWCAAFVHWSLGQNGIKGAGARGADYLNWGNKLKSPKYGAIAIFKTNHVGFYMGKNVDGTLKILHGNWSNKVSISSGVYDPIYPNQIKEYHFPINY